MNITNIVWDVETYKNVFTLCAEDCDGPFTWAFQISPWRDDSRDIIEFVQWIRSEGGRMVGFNNVGFDYPVLHDLLRMGRATAADLYDKAMRIIQCENKFENLVYPSDRYVEQLDLFRIHHFDNKARSTSLKALEFNMRMDNISDLPFPVGSTLNEDQVRVLLDYNAHDVRATKQFYHQSLDMIRFREELTKKHGRDFMNHSDVKIGKEIFQMELEKAGVQCYTYGPKGRQPAQTPRASINLGDCMPKGITLTHPEFTRIQRHLAAQTITETKGAFKDLTARVGGLDFVFGTGGLHASVEGEFFEADDEWMIYDVDVTSLYPSIAIACGYYPQHLGPRFVEVYRALKAQRVGYKKGSAENAMLKLALNGVYGASGDQFSIFFDQKFTMQITIGGQMMIALLAEWLMNISMVKIIQANTDGITVWARRDAKRSIDLTCELWEQTTGLSLEFVEYDKMAIRDVNNYICIGNGKIKRKGVYQYDKEWHQDQSALVVPKVTEKVLLKGAPIRETLMNWPDKMDFMMRVRVNRNSRLVADVDGVDHPLENTQRYYVSKGGVRLVKIMPPLAKKPDEWRRIGVESGWTVCCCNDVRDAVLPIDYEWYVQEIEKLSLGVM